MEKNEMQFEGTVRANANVKKLHVMSVCVYNNNNNNNQFNILKDDDHRRDQLFRTFQVGF